MSVINSSNGWTAKDTINSRTALALKECESGTTIELSALATLENMGEGGEITKVVSMRSTSGEYYTSISGTVYDVADDIIDMLTDEGAITVKVVKRTSKAGREFISLTIL